jgi:outer membrane protein insertion porin family
MRKNFGLIGLLVLVFSFVAPVASPFLAAPMGQAAVGSNILIEGGQRVDRETVLSYLQFRSVQEATASRIDESIKALFQTGLFADVNIVRRGNSIVIRIVENPLINVVNFEGNSEIDDDTLQKEVEVKQSMIFTKARIQSDTRRVLALYQAKGFYNVKVDPQLIRQPDNRVNVAFVISENGKTEVKNITFTGNKSFSADTLSGVLITKASSWWNPFLKNNTYDADRLEYDKELLRRYYLKNGFADIQILSADAHLVPDGSSFEINFAVEEGPRYKVADVAVDVGNASLDANGLTKVVKTGVGDTFNASKVDKSVENLTLEASNQGFVFAKVEPKVDRNSTGSTVNITYQLSEGPRAYVERIDIVGNTRTRDEVIRRELRLYEGDAFNRTLVERARRRLTALDFFSKVDFKEQPGSAPDKIVLVVDVEEKSTGSLTFSIGYSSVEAVVGSVSVAERNLFGKGLQAKLNTTLSLVKQQVDFSYTDPYFMGMPLAAGFDVFATRSDSVTGVSSGGTSTNYANTVVGGALRTGFDLDEYSSLNFKYYIAHRTISGINAATASPAFLATQNESWKSAISASYTYDDLDSPLKPTSGFRGQLVEEFAGIGGDTFYSKTEVHAWYFVPLFDEQVVVKLAGNAGHIQSIGGNDVPLQDRFFKGGDSLRGFNNAGIGPSQLNNIGGRDRIGALDYAIGSVEAQFPLGLPEALGISGEVFSDFGTAFNSNNPGQAGCTLAGGCTFADEMGLRASVGAGVVWDSPFGQLKFEYAYPIVSQPTDDQKWFNFSIGTRF